MLSSIRPTVSPSVASCMFAGSKTQHTSPKPSGENSLEKSLPAQPKEDGFFIQLLKSIGHRILLRLDPELKKQEENLKALRNTIDEFGQIVQKGVQEVKLGQNESGTPVIQLKMKDDYTYEMRFYKANAFNRFSQFFFRRMDPKRPQLMYLGAQDFTIHYHVEKSEAQKTSEGNKSSFNSSSGQHGLCCLLDYLGNPPSEAEIERFSGLAQDLIEQIFAKLEQSPETLVKVKQLLAKTN